MDTLQHGMKCFTQLVRLLLGEEAVADHKSECGQTLVVLGVEIAASFEGISCRPAPEKAVKWVQLIDEALETKRLAPGAASKMAGRLMWACGNMFHRIGRATLRPIFDQCTRRDGQLSMELQHSLQWWRHVLKSKITETTAWTGVAGPVVHIFCDAAGSGGMGAVLFTDKGTYFVHMQAPAAVTKNFVVRADNQIMGLELLAISLALSSFEDLIRKRRVVIHSDNTGSEVYDLSMIARTGLVGM